MSLKKDIEDAMIKENYDSKLDDISQLTGIDRVDLEHKIDALSFKEYIDVMTAYNEKNEERMKEILSYASEAVTQGTVNPNDPNNARQTPYQKARAGSQTNTNDITKTAQAMQRLGKENLGGVNPQQAAVALDKAEQGKSLNPQQRKAMAQQAANIDNVASDPKTASQFRQLLNKLR